MKTVIISKAPDKHGMQTKYILNINNIISSFISDVAGWVFIELIILGVWETSLYSKTKYFPPLLFPHIDVFSPKSVLQLGVLKAGMINDMATPNLRPAWQAWHITKEVVNPEIKLNPKLQWDICFICCILSFKCSGYQSIWKLGPSCNRYFTLLSVCFVLTNLIT